MTVRAALMHPSFKRFVALTAVYILALQALLGAGAQLRVALSQTPGLCTILGFQEPDRTKHAMDACAIHCVGHASQDIGGLAILATLILALGGWTNAHTGGRRIALRPALAFQGRGPPR